MTLEHQIADHWGMWDLKENKGLVVPGWHH